MGEKGFRAFYNGNELFLNTLNTKNKNYLSPEECPDFLAFFCCSFGPGIALKGI